METDAELLDAWADGDAAAGRTLYRRHCDALTKFVARKTGDDAADLVQEVFLDLLGARKGGTEIEHPRGFLFRVARNALYDRFRRGLRSFDPAVTSLRDLATGAVSRLVRDESTRLLQDALNTLPLDQQVALELYYWESLPMAQVAEVLEVTKSAAINRVHRARKALREAMVKAGASEAVADATQARFDAAEPRVDSSDESPS